MSKARRGRRRNGRTLVVTPLIPDDASTELKNALAIRNAATRSGRCPNCGAVANLVTPPTLDGIGEARMAHEDGCPALLGGD
jgi:hypothetical protein